MSRYNYCGFKIDILVDMDARSYARLATEKPHPRSAGLDQLSPAKLFDLMSGADFEAARAAARAKRDVLRAVALIVNRLSHGGRVKTAIVMARNGMSRTEAERVLTEAKGFLREVLEK